MITVRIRLRCIIKHIYHFHNSTGKNKREQNLFEIATYSRIAGRPKCLVKVVTMTTAHSIEWKESRVEHVRIRTIALPTIIRLIDPLYPWPWHTSVASFHKLHHITIHTTLTLISLAFRNRQPIYSYFSYETSNKIWYNNQRHKSALNQQSCFM